MARRKFETKKNLKLNFSRLTSFFIIIAIIFTGLVTRLVFVQLVNGEYYAAMAQAMGERPKLEIAPRGEILDRNGKKLAANDIGYSIIYTLPRTKIKDEEINKSIIQAIEILFKNGEEDKIVLNSLPIIFNGDTAKYSYRVTSDGKYDLFKFARSLKTANEFTTSFNETFDDNVFKEFQKKLEAIKDDTSTTQKEQITVFERNQLSGYDPEKDAKEVFFKFAEKYKLAAYDSTTDIINSYYNLDVKRLYAAVSMRYAIGGVQYRQYQDVEIAKHVGKETAFEFQIKGENMEGISSQVVAKRYYPNGEIGSAFLGYLGKMDDTEKNKYTDLSYDLSRELVGKIGLEYALENLKNNEYGIQLRGEPGTTYYEVDKLGRVLEESGRIDPVPGDTVVTTINLDMQEAAEKSLEEVMEAIRTGKYGETFPSYRGAVVAMDINTGEVLALASRPGFDPNDFAETGRPGDPLKLEEYQLTVESFKEAKEDKYNLVPLPMFSYATQGIAAPGSIFKPFTAIAALEEGVITENRLITDKGEYDVPESTKTIKCWLFNDKKITHGSINVVTALKKSCNYFFNQVGEELGNDRFGEWAQKLGIAKDKDGNMPGTGIEISESSNLIWTPGVIQSNAANELMGEIVSVLGKLDNGGYTIEKNNSVYKAIYDMLMSGVYDVEKLEGLGITNKNARNAIETRVNRIKVMVRNTGAAQVPYMSIGQGSLALTPLQMAQLYSTLVNGGTKYKAHLVKQVIKPDGTVEEIAPEVLAKLNFDQDNVKTVLKGMGEVTDDGGTASGVFKNYPIPTGGKTGTAQSGSTHPDRAAYAWYAGFGPFDEKEDGKRVPESERLKPEIVVIAVVYDGGHGNYAANIAKAVFDAYSKHSPQIQEYLEKKNKGQ